MRMIHLLLALAISGCASDLVDSSPGTGPVASALILSPDSTAVDAAATLQFVATAEWSDGNDHPASVTYRATGGVISSNGLYQAATTPGVFLVIATCTCGVADTALVTVTEPFRAVVISVVPAVALLDTSATQAFVPAVTWSDSSDHPAQLTWSATGGSISAVGVYRAGTAAGQFRVIATCGCGLADTVSVTIAPNTPPALASLVLGVTGLPSGALAALSVSGPGGYARSFTAGAAIDSLLPGTYELRASSVSVGTSLYSPNSAVQTVTLSAGAPGSLQVSYRLLSTNGVPPHPRVWMTPERITRLLAQVASNSTRWTRVRAAADGQLGRGAAFTWEDLDKLPDLCLAYLGTRDGRYAVRAGTILTAYAVESNTLTGDSGYGFRFNLPLVTMGLDWCYDGLTVAQRQQAATWLMNRADWVWPESNAARALGYGTNEVDNNYYWGFMMTGPAALAAAGDDIGSGTISGADRPTFHRQLVLSRWSREALPFFQGAGEGGAWAEGTNYESTWRLGAFADAFLTAGVPVSTPFLEASLRWRIHSTMPRGLFKAPLGDQPRVSDASLFTYDRLSALYALPPANASSTLTSQVYAWLNLIGQVPTSEFNATAPLADELLRFDPAQSVAPDFSALPKWFHAVGPGFFTYRQSWTDPNATAMVFESGPTSGHGARDANGLMIWKGSSWISATSNIYSHSGIEGDSRNYNNMTVGTAGQILIGGNGGVIPVAPQVSDQLVVVRGQGKNGYGYPNGISYGRTVVSDYLRTVAYLPQLDVFVIVDQATVFNAASAKIWRWHMRDVPDVNGNTFRLQSPAGDFRCFGSVLAPGDVVLGTQSFALGNGPSVTSNAVTVSMSGRASDVVVTVLQCTGSSAAPYVPTATVNASEAVVMIAGRRVVVPLAASTPVRVE